MFSHDLSVDRRAQTIRRLNSAGLALVCAAFVLPFLPVGAHGRLEMEPALALVGVTTAWVATQVLAWIMFKGKGDLAIAKSRVLVGIALLCVVGSNMAEEVSQPLTSGSTVVSTAQPVSETKEQAFTRQALAMDEKYNLEFEALGNKFRDADISRALTPEGVTTSAGLVSGRALVTKYRALLDERKKLLAKKHADTQRLLKQKAPSEDAKKQALYVLEQGRARIDKINTELDYAQRGLADAMWDLLTWFQSQLGKVAVNKGKVVYFVAEQKLTVDPLFEKLRYAEAHQRAVFERGAKEQALADAIDAAPAGSAEVASAPAGKIKVVKKK